MAKKSKTKMSKSSLLTRVGGIVAVLALVSTGLDHLEGILDKAKDLLNLGDSKNKCFNIKMSNQEEVPYSRISDLDIFQIQVDNACSYSIMVRVEFEGNQSLQIIGDPNDWPEYMIDAESKDFLRGIILPNPSFLTDEREFQAAIKWSVFMDDGSMIGQDTKVIKIVDDVSISAE